MKAVILAGGLGSRLSEETQSRPKPMVKIGDYPIIWHILKSYAAHGINEFVICAGYKGYVIKEYFSNYLMHMSDLTIDMARNDISIHRNKAEDWKITIINTGESTMTGGRIKRIQDYVGDETFCCTYGDGVGDIDLTALIAHHKASGNKATLTGVQPPGRFGALSLNQSQVVGFQEKPVGDNSWINGGFFVLDPAIFDYIAADETIWEQEPLKRLASEGELGAYIHRGFWHPMDTLRDKNYLENLWQSGNAPWKIW